MNRVFKFRGRDLFNVWNFGGITPGNTHIVGQHVVGKGRRMTKVDPDTVGQFTGFKDIEEHEIYEDDFIQNDEHPELIYRVTMYEGCWTGVEVCYPWDNSSGQFEELCWLLEHAPFKVIGNTFDNPRILEDVEKEMEL